MDKKLIAVAVVIALALGAAACKRRAASGRVSDAAIETGGYSVAAEQPPPFPSEEQVVTATPQPGVPEEQPTSPAPPLPPEEGAASIAPPALPEEPAGTEVLTRGPVHEAFAEPVNLQVEADLVVPDQPPPEIEEVPPAERPQGESFVWVPGYWSWDADRTAYIWVSACWRLAPPSMYWVPGYWAQVTGGWRWVAGYWAPVGSAEVEYLPPPPQSYDLQPPAPAPTPDSFWVPPCDYWDQGQFVRRPGYWLTAQPGWVWIPSHYVRTPRGYVFIRGHWDYSLERRGLLFAPVYFPPSVRIRPGFTYSPTVLVNVRILTVNLFVYPSYCHYYFGDYYDDAYLRVGIYPWFDSVRIHRWYDPLYVHDRWRHHKTDPRWEEHERHEYDLRRANKDLRPPRTYGEMESRLAKTPKSQQEDLQLAQPLSVVAAGKASPLKFERINTEARDRIAKQAAEEHALREGRSRTESPIGPKAGPAPAARREAVAPRREREESVTQPVERAEPGAPRRERREQGTPPTERREAAAPRRDRQDLATPSVEGRGPVTPPRDRREAVTPPADRRESVTPPREAREPIIAPADRRDTATPPLERRESVTPPGEASEPVTGPAGRRDTATPPRERREQVTPPTERTDPATPRRERDEPAAQPAEPRSPAATPRDRRESVSPPTDRREPASTSRDRREPATPPREARESAAAPADRREATTPSRAAAEPATPPRERRETGTPPASTKAPDQTVQPPAGQPGA